MYSYMNILVCLFGITMKYSISTLMNAIICLHTYICLLRVYIQPYTYLETYAVVHITGDQLTRQTFTFNLYQTLHAAFGPFQSLLLYYDTDTRRPRRNVCSMSDQLFTTYKLLQSTFCYNKEMLMAAKWLRLGAIEISVIVFGTQRTY